MADKADAGGGTRQNRHGWTRRATLGAMAALCSVPGLPALALARDGLRETCLRAVGTQAAFDLGAAAAGRRNAVQIEIALRARLPGVAGREAWTEALREAGRRDLEVGDTMELKGVPLTRTEAEMLALGACIAAAPAA